MRERGQHLSLASFAFFFFVIVITRLEMNESLDRSLFPSVWCTDSQLFLPFGPQESVFRECLSMSLWFVIECLSPAVVLSDSIWKSVIQVLSHREKIMWRIWHKYYSLETGEGIWWGENWGSKKSQSRKEDMNQGRMRWEKRQRQTGWRGEEEEGERLGQRKQKPLEPKPQLNSFLIGNPLHN